MKIGIVAMALSIGSISSSCGPQYVDYDYYLGEFSFDYGKNHFELVDYPETGHFSQTYIKATINEDEYYYWDIVEIARITNEQSGLDYRIKAQDDPDYYPFPTYRERKITLSGGSKAFSVSACIWNFSFRYHDARFIFHFYYRPRTS